jgi:hypothetical protein
MSGIQDSLKTILAYNNNRYPTMRGQTIRGGRYMKKET